MPTHQLKRIVPVILSVVDDPANQTPFYVKKELEMPDLKELFPLAEEVAAIFGEDYQAKGLTEPIAETVKKALTDLSQWHEELTPEMKSALGVLARALNYGDHIAEPVPEDAEKVLHPKLDENLNKVRTYFEGCQKALAKVLEHIRVSKEAEPELDLDTLMLEIDIPDVETAEKTMKASEFLAIQTEAIAEVLAEGVTQNG